MLWLLSNLINKIEHLGMNLYLIYLLLYEIFIFCMSTVYKQNNNNDRKKTVFPQATTPNIECVVITE